MKTNLFKSDVQLQTASQNPIRMQNLSHNHFYWITLFISSDFFAISLAVM